MSELRTRPAVDRGRKIPERLQLTEKNEAAFIDNARKMLV